MKPYTELRPTRVAEWLVFKRKLELGITIVPDDNFDSEKKRDLSYATAAVLSRETYNLLMRGEVPPLVEFSFESCPRDFFGSLEYITIRYRKLLPQIEERVFSRLEEKILEGSASKAALAAYYSAYSINKNTRDVANIFFSSGDLLTLLPIIYKPYLANNSGTVEEKTVDYMISQLDSDSFISLIKRFMAIDNSILDIIIRFGVEGVELANGEDGNLVIPEGTVLKDDFFTVSGTGKRINPLYVDRAKKQIEQTQDPHVTVGRNYIRQCPILHNGIPEEIIKFHLNQIVKQLRLRFGITNK